MPDTAPSARIAPSLAKTQLLEALAAGGLELNAVDGQAVRHSHVVTMRPLVRMLTEVVGEVGLADHDSVDQQEQNNRLLLLPLIRR